MQSITQPLPRDGSASEAWPGPEAFCADVRGGLVAALALYGGDRAVAEELAQEALVRTWERWDRVTTPRAFAYRVGFNLSRSVFRRLAAERRARAHLEMMTPREAHQPDSATTLAVRQAVAALPDRQRAAIVARYFSELSVAEAAQALACAEGTIRALTAQGIASLRRSGLSFEESTDA